MEIQEIEAYIGPDGQVRLSVGGVQGPGCLTLTEDLERALGGQVLARELKPESWQEAQAPVQQSETLRPGW